MNKSQAMIAIARLNKCAKHILAFMNVGIKVDFDVINDDLEKVANEARSLRSYVSANLSDFFLFPIESLTEPSVITEYAKESLTTAKQIQTFEKMTKSISDLKMLAKAYRSMKMEEQYAGLVVDFHTPEALAAFQKAVKAGLLTDDYMPNKLSRRTKKYLAMALSQYSNLPNRRSWTVFKDQWGDSEFRHVRITINKEKEREKILAIFPETDFDSMSKHCTEDHFDVTNTEDEILALFTSLITYHYVDPQTKFSDFLKVFGIGDMEYRKPVNWIAEVKDFCAFIHCAFDATNRRIWGRACQCFVHNGNPFHKPTLLSQRSLMTRKQTEHSYYLKMKSICSEFNKNVIM